MALNSNHQYPSPAASALEWKFSQVFGEQNPGEEVQEIDIISTVAFERSGDYLAIGDRGGRVVVFEKKAGKDDLVQQSAASESKASDEMVGKQLKFQYKTEFQSHEPEFDYLKSLEIDEKINKVSWCPTPNGSLFILSANDRTIKLWKIKENKVKKVKEMDLNRFVSSENSLLAERSYVSGNAASTSGYYLEWRKEASDQTSPTTTGHTEIADMSIGTPARCRKVYGHAHDFNINSISNNSDGETFLSADDLRVNLWNLEVSNQCFNIIDMKPRDMEDLIEVITSAEFHPFHCNLLAYSSSRGFIRLVDMRQSALCDKSARILQDAQFRGCKSFFTEIVASISDMKFATDGRHILSRDYMNLKVWDTHMETTPVATYNIHEHLRPKLSELYNNDAIFDKFGCCLSRDGHHFVTGSYSLLRIFSYGTGDEEGTTVEARKNPNRKPHPQTAPRARRSSLSNWARGFYRQGRENLRTRSTGNPCDLNRKLLHLAWHPTDDVIACAVANSLFLYHA